MLSRQCFLLLGLVPIALAQNAALPAHEAFTYSIEWRLITAGRVRIERQQARNSAQVNFRMESAGMVSKLFKVADDYSANFNQDGCVESTTFLSEEGSRRRDSRILFDVRKHKASYTERDRNKNIVLQSHEIDTQPCVRDVAGALFYLRTLNLEPGHSVNVAVSDGKKSVVAKVEAQQREDVKTPAGVFHTIRYEAYLFNGVLYRRAAHLNIWLTDDARRLPVQIRVRMQFAIGTISLQLEKHE